MKGGYLLDRKTLWVMVFALLIGAVLIFIAGLLIGVNYRLPSQVAEAQSLPNVPARSDPASSRPTPPKPSPALPRPTAPSSEVTIDLPSESPEPDSPVPETQSPETPPRPDPRPVAEPTPEPPPTSVFGDTPRGPYTLQVGAFLSSENVGEYVESLQAKGYEPYIHEVTNSRGTTLATVRVGAYSSQREADAAAAEFHKREGEEVLVRLER